jgi:rod shape-determining protein MreD
MKIFIWLMVILLTLALQVSLFGHWRPLGVAPDLMLVVVLVVALWLQATTAMATAVVGGLLLDLSSGVDFGLRTAFFALTALMVIAARQYGLHAESVLTSVLLLLLTTAAFNLAVVVSAGSPLVDWAYVLSKTGWEMVINAIILLLVLSVRGLLSDHRSRVASELRRGSWL